MTRRSATTSAISLATFDPAACTSCTLFAYCRNELRTSGNPADLLVEIGVPADERPQVVGLVDGTGEVGAAAASTLAQVTATLDGVARPTGQAPHRPGRRTRDGQRRHRQVRQPPPSASTGWRSSGSPANGTTEWTTTVFDDPQVAQTRRAVMRALGQGNLGGDEGPPQGRTRRSRSRSTSSSRTTRPPTFSSRSPTTSPASS